MYRQVTILKNKINNSHTAVIYYRPDDFTIKETLTRQDIQLLINSLRL